MLFNFLHSFEKIAETSKAYDKIAYDVGEAFTYLKESSSKSNSLSGELYASSEGALLLSVPNSLVKGSFDALGERGVNLPKKNGRFNANILVMTKDEIKQVGGLEKITERGHRFNYNIGSLHEAPVTNSFDFSKVWFFPVSSSELSQLRKSYGLSPSPGKHGFHIVVALRKLGVLGNNNVSKLAALQKLSDILPGGAADDMPDKKFDKKKLMHAQKHELEHTTNKAIAKEVAKDHMLEDENYYQKLQKIEKKEACFKLSNALGLSKKAKTRTVTGHESNANVITPSAEDAAFLGSLPSKPKQAPNTSELHNKSRIRKAVIEATEDTFGSDPSLKEKEASWKKILFRMMELGLR